MFIERLSREDIDNFLFKFFSNKYNNLIRVSKYDAKSLKLLKSKHDILNTFRMASFTQKNNCIQAQIHYSQHIKKFIGTFFEPFFSGYGYDITYTINDFSIQNNKYDSIPQIEFLSFMYEKFGEEYLYYLKEHLENSKQEKIIEIDNKNKRIIDELTK